VSGAPRASWSFWFPMHCYRSDTLSYYVRLDTISRYLENIMQYVHTQKAERSSLRLVFSDKVVSLGFAANATMGDVARALRSITVRNYGSPVAIDVTLGLDAVKHAGFVV
jgi:hypothetical protein